ncbi:signal recognition particle-docking protein FtsY [Candidatus Liberibacter americanus]|uniref:Signal recognition particle receptor FtsY n=1 Tax=Candidatus Liberibacter americanus str. Sao Paulo TaxID=1261131 RepID=U6B6W7_9HYPH|nr:signal recognition particle-docking protein FtsY [Candidatus Liberibacter americanus]AHA27616.1 Signal recognition particle GTPase [Candidatus Liberibacter americanus str. Sao Paulo]EMS36324.1 cell division protein [Candidatus Liberibacter americanus PW_SP]
MLLSYFRKKKSIAGKTPSLDSENKELDEKFIDASEDKSPSKSFVSEELCDQEYSSKDSSWFRLIADGFSITALKIKDGITNILLHKKLDDSIREELEDLLIRSDIGVEAAQIIVDDLVSRGYEKNVSVESVLKDMSSKIHEILLPISNPFNLDLSHKPYVILVVGVNGVGKTTAIGKLSKRMSDDGLKVMLAAGDTFRSAAVDQLRIWADRTGSDFVSSEIGSDAAAIAYDAFIQAKKQDTDVLIIDTAGRTNNNIALMAGIGKIIRVLKRIDVDAPHEVLQILDATTGQNSLRQVEMFSDIAGVTGIIMSKLDGTARGGVLVSMAIKHQIPVYFIGVGEGVDDLEPFISKDFAEAIVGI